MGVGDQVLFAVCGFELLLLFYAYKSAKGTWEHMWVLAVESFAYGCSALVPDAPWVTLQLANGRELPWLRYMGWLLVRHRATCTPHHSRRSLVRLRRHVRFSSWG